MAARSIAPRDPELKAALGTAWPVWTSILESLATRFDPLDRQWKPSKAAFGRMCLLQHRQRTLVYLTPEAGAVTVAVVLGERAVGLAMDSALPAAIKTLIAGARPYVEGRGIRFAVRNARDVRTVAKLVELKTTPK